MQLGAMQDWPLRIMRLIDHAEREHGNVRDRRPPGPTGPHDTDQLAQASPSDARRMAQALERLGDRSAATASPPWR